MRRRFLAIGLAAVCGSALPAAAQTPPRLNEHCIVSVLNRNTRVKPDGSWVLPNIPANFGLVRARATCVEDGRTISGESAPFLLVAGAAVNVPPIVLGPTTPIPRALVLTASAPELTAIGATSQTTATGHYANGTTRNLTSGAAGTTYVISNPRIATVSADGLVQALASGAVLVQATHEGTSGFLSMRVVLSADSDGDGLPDDVELSLGLDPNNPADALTDEDRDGLTTAAEFTAGTNIGNPDTDGDGILDGEEVFAGADGFVTNPLLADSDGDGVRDGLEIATGSNPTDAASVALGAALSSISVAPPTFTITVNSVQGTAFVQVTVTGQLRDGTTIDLTSTARGTNYTSSNLDVCNFGAPDGRVFGSQAGPCTITVTNGPHTAQAAGTVASFTPRSLGSLAIPGYANNVDVNGTFAYVAAGAAGLQVVNVSDPAAPFIAGSLDTPGNANDVRVAGTLAYVADGIGGLRIIDVSNPASPVLAGALDTPGEASDVAVVGTRVFVADGASGLQIVDAVNPAAPALLRTVDTPGFARGVDVEGTTAVIADDNGLRVVDVSNPATASLVGSLPLGGEIIDVDLDGGHAIVAAYTGGMHVVDVRVASAPILVGGLPGSAPNGFVPRDVQVAGEFALFAEQLFANAVAPVVSIESPATPVLRGVVDFGQDYAGTGIAISGPYVYWTGQSFFVGDENGTTGTTRLFVGQYISLEDRGGIAPSVEIAQPANGATAVEGSSLLVRANATDDIAVASVRFLVNGASVFTDTSQPFEAQVTMPAAVASVVLGAEAADLAGNIGTAPAVTITVVPDPLTTVAGRVVSSTGAPIAGATVTALARQVLSAADGSFSIPGVPTVQSTLRVSVEAVIDGRTRRGFSGFTAVVPGGVTNVGDVRLGAFDALYAAAFNGPTGPASLYSMDRETGVATLIGPIGFWRVTAMDASSDGTLYAIGRNPSTGRNVLLTIDPATGAGTEIGPTGVEFLGFGDTFADISFRPFDGVLFGYLEAGDGLGRIDVATGAAAALGSSGVSCCGNGLAFAPDGRLLHANERALHVLDQTTGLATRVVTLSYPTAAGSFPRINSMDFNPDTGELIGFVRNNNGGTQLAAVDVVTGGVTLLGERHAINLDAIVWGPGR